jgi:RNA polymerase sigma-70 factor, ECF subfamily
MRDESHPFASRSAFQVFYMQWRKPILNFVLTMVKDQRIAEELTQDVFLKAYRNRDTFQDGSKVTTWLWSIAKNTSLDHLRRKAEVPLYVDAQGGDVSIDLMDQELSAEQKLIEATDRSRIDHCLGLLPDATREVIALRIHSELEYQEISDLMGWPLGTIKTEIFRAKQQLKKCFATQEGDPDEI